MISVEEALERIAASFEPLTAETVVLDDAAGRVLAEAAIAQVTQPPTDLSAMDGYAIRFHDVLSVPASLRIVGEAPAGGAYAATLEAGEAVRIFTGGPVPAGADTIVIQENTKSQNGLVTILQPPQQGRHIRRAGLDFRAGLTRLPAGTVLSPRHLALLAGMNLPRIAVHRRPRIGLLATGNELVLPGQTPGPNQIVASSGYGLAAMIQRWGGAPIVLGIVRDDTAAIVQALRSARDCDLLVTLGGASVGDHDLVQAALKQAGGSLDFWKIAMRPGKPLMFGHVGALPLLGLPGNPVSALVCALLFLRASVLKMTGRSDIALPLTTARAGAPLAANDQRQDYLRAGIARDGTGELTATAFKTQDSSMVSLLAQSGALIVRRPHAPAVAAGGPVEILLLDEAGLGF
ncbi:MAG: moeA 1 [Alphaproteobacteria bacterium]|nr:moeA 1 [Alphaproteobacteria bacterium]